MEEWGAIREHVGGNMVETSKRLKVLTGGKKMTSETIRYSLGCRVLRISSIFFLLVPVVVVIEHLSFGMGAFVLGNYRAYR